MSEVSKEGTEQVKEGVVEAEKEVKPPKNSQKYSVETWRKVKAEFQAGSYLSLKALAKKYGINPITLNTRMNREKWNEEQRSLQNKVEAVIERKVLKEVDLASDYLAKSFERTKRYEKLVDASQEYFGSKTADGTALLDPDALDSYSKTESRIHEWAKSCLRIIPVSQVDHTSNGESLGQSFISAIAKLRGNPESPKLSDQDLGRVLEAEVE